MANKKRARGSQRAKSQAGSSLSATELDEALEVFGRAESLYPKLLSRREFHAAELQKLDQALAKLRPIVDARGGAPRAAAVSVRKPKQPGKRPVGRPPGSGRTNGAPTIASLILAVLSRAKEPMSASEIEAGIRSQRPNIGTAGLQQALKKLRDNAHVKASGKAKRFRYALARGGAAAAPAPAAAAKPAAKPAAAKPAAKKKAGKAPAAKKAPGRKPGSTRGGATPVRAVVLSALNKGKPLSLAELLEAIKAERPDVKRKSAETMIHDLRRKGAVKTSGETGNYRYSV